MTDGVGDIIKMLEQRKTAIDRALAALHEIDGSAPDWVGSVKPARVPKKRSAAVRKKMREAQLLRYAKLRGEA